MSENGDDSQLEPEKPGWFENQGIRYIAYLNRKTARISPAANDQELTSSVRRITTVNSLLAFAIGAISAAGTVYTEHLLDQAPFAIKYGWVGGVTAILTGVEFAVLFFLSLNTVHYIAMATGHAENLFDKSSQIIALPNLLARAALEIPDPVRHALGIDPLARVSRRKLLLVGFLYKAKIMASNVLAKLVLKRFFGKGVFRAGVNWVSVPITGLWNGFVIWKVARDARLRLCGNMLAEHIAREILTDEVKGRLSPAAREACLRAIGNSVVLTQNSHPNMLILLMKMHELFEKQKPDRIDDWEIFLKLLGSLGQLERYFVLDLLAIATAFDGRISSLEKKMLPQAFQETTGVYMARIKRLRKLLLDGRLHAASKECHLDFAPG